MSKMIPLSVPDELLAEVRKTAKRTNLSMQDVIRQSTRLGMPRLCEQLAAPAQRLTNVEPLPRKVLEDIYSRPERDEEGIDGLIAAQPKGVRD
jgi:hypothetical protein